MKKKTKKIMWWTIGFILFLVGAIYLSFFTFKPFICPNGQEVVGNFIGLLSKNKICNLI